jgi:hypothetical protein
MTYARKINLPIALMLAIIITMATSIVVTAAPTDWGCDDLERYKEQTIADTVMDLDTEHRETLAYVFGSEFDLRSARPSQLIAASEALDAWATALEGVDEDDVPAAAAPMHEALIDTLSLMANITNAMASGGALAVLAYEDQVAEITEQQSDAEEFGYQKCGSDWADVFGQPGSDGGIL